MSSDFTALPDLAARSLRGAVIAASDDFFAEKENLLKPEPARFLPDEYTDRGKWMDGWESRRKRVPGHDWAIVRLGVPGVVRGLVIDTAFFRGNYPSHASVEGCALPLDAPPAALLDPGVEWIELLPRAPLAGDSKNHFPVLAPWACTHLRLNIFPDGGVARLRVHGEAVPDWRRQGHARGEVELAAADQGGDVIACSDMFFGERRNLIAPDRARHMGEGWETRRRRGPGHDWALVRLAARATISRLIVDTHHFKGNYPDRCTVEAIDAPGAEAAALAEHAGWAPLLGESRLLADARHWFEEELAVRGPVTHLRLNVFPDGGVSRLRVYGSLDEEARQGLGLRRLNTLLPGAAAGELRAVCAARRWALAVAAGRPYASLAALIAASDEAWSRTGAEDWHEALAAHPRIGEQKAAVAQGPAAAAWSTAEQARVAGADDGIKARLREINERYEARFGFLYLVCAGGRSAEELLALAEQRLGNDPAHELTVAAAEQNAITRLRLRKLVEP